MGDYYLSSSLCQLGNMTGNLTLAGEKRRRKKEELHQSSQMKVAHANNLYSWGWGPQHIIILESAFKYPLASLVR
jgi:hypothetical protein